MGRGGLRSTGRGVGLVLMSRDCAVRGGVMRAMSLLKQGWSFCRPSARAVEAGL